MLPFQLHTAKPLIENKLRLVALYSGSQFGQTTMHDEWLIQHLDNFVGGLDDTRVSDVHSRLVNRDYPDLERHKSVSGRDAPSDILLKETGRQHKGIEERYRKKLVGLANLKKIAEPSTKYHISCSRGIERMLVDLFNQMEAEALDRRLIQPI